MKNVKENANRYSIQVLTIRGDNRVTNVLQNAMKNEQCQQVRADPPNPKKNKKNSLWAYGFHRGFFFLTIRGLRETLGGHQPPLMTIYIYNIYIYINAYVYIYIYIYLFINID